jgi:hypothetical protein
MRRPLVALALAALLALAGCAGLPVPPAEDDPSPVPGDGPADPAEDVRGWEGGYWANESLDVDASDGLSDAELDAVVARAMARVEVIRGVEFDADVPVSTVARETFRDRDRSTPPPALRTFDDAKMEALLLVGEDESATAVQRANRGASVGGYYSSGRDEIVLVTDGDRAVLEETTLGHELVHAWQDRRFDLASLRADTRDGANGRNGIVEGDAELVQYRYDRRCGAEWDCVAPPDDGGGGGGGVANYGVFALKFHPYSDGPGFVLSRYRAGGWDAVNAVYRDLPASAEQVTHPDAYGTDPPTDVTLRDRTGGDWERVRPGGRPDHGTVGQAGVMALLVHPLYDSDGEAGPVAPDEWLNRTDDGAVSDFDPLNYDHPYAAGWDGDRLHVYRNGDRTGYVWRLVWDSPAEAREFLDGYRRVLDYWGAEARGDGVYVVPDGPFADAFHAEREGDTVTVVNAPTRAALGDVRTTLSVEAGAETPDPPDDDDPATVPTPGAGPLAALLAVTVAAFALRRRQ